MANGWESSKGWSDRFVGDIGAICGRYMVGPSRVEDDRHFNTDMRVLVLRDVRIACRIRDHKYVDRYGGEFTIRAGRPTSGNKTELAKIVEGWGDYLFYGFADQAGASLCAWFLGDLSVFRGHLGHHMATNAGALPGSRQANCDGSSWFMSFQLADMPPGFVVARQPYAAALRRAS